MIDLYMPGLDVAGLKVRLRRRACASAALWLLLAVALSPSSVTARAGNELGDELLLLQAAAADAARAPSLRRAATGGSAREGRQAAWLHIPKCGSSFGASYTRFNDRVPLYATLVPMLGFYCAIPGHG